MKKKLHRVVFHIGRITVHVGRWTWYLSAAVLVLLAILFSLARYYLPVLAEKKPELEAYLSQKAAHPVRIEQLTTYWDGIHPGLRAQGVQLYAAEGAPPAIRLSEVRLTLALLPLLRGKLGINSLAVVNPSILLERLENGSFRVSGYDLLRSAESSGDEKLVDWLFRQNELEIENGELLWSDRKQDPAVSLRLSKVNFSLKNRGDRHRLGIGAVFPPELCGECSLIIDITGDPFTVSEWNGEIYLRAQDLNVASLPLIVREKLPAGMRGKFTTQLWTQWSDGWPSSVTGHVGVARLKLPIPGWNSPLSLVQAGGDLKWRTQGDAWRLDLAELTLGLSGPSWPAGDLRLTHRTDESEIRISHLNLDDITHFVETVKTEMQEAAPANPVFAYWLSSKPHGAVDRFKLSLKGDWKAPADFSMEADAKNIHVLPYLNFPGVRGFNARLKMTGTSGSAKLTAVDASLSLPFIFHDPLPIRYASGDIAWEKSDEEWVIHGKDLRTTSEDASGTGKLLLRLPRDSSVSPYLNLRVDFSNGNGANASRYYPVSHLTPGTRAWMERSFVAGEITHGYLIYDGLIREFPFRNHRGKFELRGQVQKAVYRYLPGWEPITQGQVDVAIDGPEVRVTGSGKIGSLDARQVVVQTRRDADQKNWVYVSGNVIGPVDETIGILSAAVAAPSAKWSVYFPPGLHGNGNGALDLNVAIPIGDLKSIIVAGDYRLTNAELKFHDAGLGMRALDGNVRFTQLGIHDGKLRGEFLGGVTTFTAEQVDDRLVLQALGNVKAQELSPLLGARLAARVSGSANWSAVWRQGQGLGNLSMLVEMQRLQTTLPPPLNRPDALAHDNLRIKSELSTLNSQVLGISLGTQLSGKLALVRAADGWNFAGGRIGFGEARVALPRERGLYLSARLDDVDLDQWQTLSGEGQPALPVVITRLSAEARSVEVTDRQLENLSFDVSKIDEVWSGVINGPQIAGKINFSGAGSTRRIGLDLTYLVLPEKIHEGSSSTFTDPRRLPALEVRSQSFQVTDKQLGELDFAAVPVADGWKVDRLRLTRPEMRLSVNGMWRQVGDQHKSECAIDFHSSDMGKTMEAFGAPDQLAGGEVSVTSRLSWPGAPAAAGLVNLDGDVEFSAQKGRFLQVRPGAGRLFGLLDLSAMGRYLTLDFSPVFGKGLIFDRIDGTVAIEHGNAYAQDFKIKSPAAEVSAAGRVGLAAEDFDLTVQVQPKLSNGLTLTTWGIWGPQVAATVLAVQKIFKKQIAEGTRVTYTVKGSWDKPAVSKTTRSDAKKIRDAGPITGE